MKTKILLLLSAAIFALTSVTPLLAQEPPPSDDKAGPEGKPHGPMGMLTPEEREKLRAAHDKIKDKPGVKDAADKRDEANRKFRDAMHDAMLAADPTIEPLLKKMDESRP